MVDPWEVLALADCRLLVGENKGTDGGGGIDSRQRAAECAVNESRRREWNLLMKHYGWRIKRGVGCE